MDSINYLGKKEFEQAFFSTHMIKIIRKKRLLIHSCGLLRLTGCLRMRHRSCEHGFYDKLIIKLPVCYDVLQAKTHAKLSE